MRTKPNDTKA